MDRIFQIVHQIGDQNSDHLIGMLVYCAEGWRIKKCVAHGLIVEAKATDPQGRCMFVLTVEDNPLEVGFQRLNGCPSDVLSDVGNVLKELVPNQQFEILAWRQPLVFTPSLKASLE